MKDRYEYRIIPPDGHLFFWDNETQSELPPELVAVTLNGLHKKVELLSEQLQNILDLHQSVRRQQYLIQQQEAELEAQQQEAQRAIAKAKQKLETDLRSDRAERGAGGNRA